MGKILLSIFSLSFPKPRSPAFISGHGDKAGQGWTGQAVMRSTSQGELTPGGQRLQLLSARIHQRRMRSGRPHFCDTKDASCGLEI